MAELTWPDGCTLVSVQRGTLVLVPVGSTELFAGDVVTAFGSEAAEQSIIGRLSARSDIDATVEMTLEFPRIGD